MPWFVERRIEEIGLREVCDAYPETLKLPLYQRNAVWSEGRICALWDSLLRGFPLPSFLLTRGSGASRLLGVNGVIGEVIEVDEVEDAYFDVLDGQQRLAAIIAGFAGNPSIRLWIDLAPPQPPHPLRFKYWLHPCTKIFPFGFHMQVSGEYDFQPLTDSTLQQLWQSIQAIGNWPGQDYYQLPLEHTFPWEANCPILLSNLLELPDAEDLEEKIATLALRHRPVLQQFGKPVTEPHGEVITTLAHGLRRVKNAKLALQLICLEDIEPGEDEDENASYEIFQRIGRGGVPITPRQLAVSKLMLTLGKPGHDALAGFQQSYYGKMIEAEDVIHALTRVALAGYLAENNDENGDDCDMLDLSVVRLHRIKNQHPLVWQGLAKRLGIYCNPLDGDGETRLSHALKDVFELLRFRPDANLDPNPNGFSLLQLSCSTHSEEGIAPITLHPLLLWELEYSNGEPPVREQQDDMLRWILFANGLTRAPQDNALNRKVFDHVRNEQGFSFQGMLALVFNDVDENGRLRETLGFRWSEPRLSADGAVVDISQDHHLLPTPREMAVRSARRLLLRNWADSGVNRFLLMWNQRVGLDAMYGHTLPEDIPALFGKGRPFDADHVVARHRLLNYTIEDAILQQGCSVFFGNDADVVNHFVRDGCFRKNFPHMQGNYRFWPKRLNRADRDDDVATKMDMEQILGHLQGHPLYDRFNQAEDASPWRWSGIPPDDHMEWSPLPPHGNIWTADLVEQFIRCVLKREHFLYGNTYCFLTGQAFDDLDCEGILD